MAETLGYKRALEWLKENGYHKVILESDCLQLVQA